MHVCRYMHLASLYWCHCDVKNQNAQIHAYTYALCAYVFALNAYTYALRNIHAFVTRIMYTHALKHTYAYLMTIMMLAIRPRNTRTSSMRPISWCVYVIYLCVYASVYVWMHARMWVRMYLYMHAFVHAHLISISMHTKSCRPFSDTWIHHVYMNACLSLSLSLSVCVCVYIYIYIYIYILAGFVWNHYAYIQISMLEYMYPHTRMHAVKASQGPLAQACMQTHIHAYTVLLHTRNHMRAHLWRIRAKFDQFVCREGNEYHIDASLCM